MALGLSLRPRRWTRIPAEGRLMVPALPSSEPSRTWWWALAAITVVGLLLRLVRLNTDLWLDEIATVVAYRGLGAWELITSYSSTNNHLLNTLLVKLASRLFGEQEWAVRLPAVAFGVATLPAYAWVAREVLPPRASLGATLLLAVSYHHIFFSQNARGYTAYLLVALASSAALTRALHEDRLRLWAIYAAVMVVGFASLLISVFLFAGHLIVGAMALVAIRQRGGPLRPMLGRLAGVFMITAALGLTLYVAVLPQAFVVMRTVYVLDPAAGFPALSREFVAELTRGLSAGFGSASAIIAVPLAAVAAVGYLDLLRRCWPLILALTAPLVLMAAFFVAGGFVVSPRHFLLLLPLSMLVAVAGFERLGAFTAAMTGGSQPLSGGVKLAVIALAVVASAASLPGYYSTPKQAYRAAVDWVASAASPGDAVVAIHYASGGVQYYGERIGWKEGRDFFHARSVAALDRVVAAHAGRVSWLVVTFPRALRLSVPDLDRHIRSGWTVVREFPGTLGDGTVTIWRRPPQPQS